MGPTALISWIRNAGLEYRPEREALWTIGLELNALSRSVTKFKRNLRSKTKADKFSDAIANYVYSILCYSRVSKDKAWPGFSLFRSYEDEFDAVPLQVRLECRKLEGPEYSSELLKSRFYEHELVLASEHNIKSLCDEYLPAAWQEVCRAHRAVRAAAGYPDSANKKST